MIIVLGSATMDVSSKVPRFPAPGETLIGSSYNLAPGGKGANQAVAAALAGAETAFYGCVGGDAFGSAVRENFRAKGLKLDGLLTLDGFQTGCASIFVEEHGGENCIAFVGGANTQTRAAQVPDTALGPATTVVLQMEIDPAQNWALMDRAKAAGARVVLSNAPAGEIPGAALRQIDFLIVNEGEGRVVADALGLAADGPESIARALAETGDLSCVMTLGAQGAIAVGKGAMIKVPAMPIQAVDTTGAGDAFAGIFAATLDRGLGVAEAMRHAAAGAGLSCLGFGAQAALPGAEAIAEAVPRIEAAETAIG
jgi:ribokinase